MQIPQPHTFIIILQSGEIGKGKLILESRGWRQDTSWATDTRPAQTNPIILYRRFESRRFIASALGSFFFSISLLEDSIVAMFDSCALLGR